MTFKKFAKAALLFPATVLSSITNSLLGAYQRSPAGEIRREGSVNRTDLGLLGYTLTGIRYVGLSVSNFVYNHQKAIATAFWASSILAGAAALTVFLWPAALAAVTTFTIAGLSIAGVVGANVLAQIGAVAALTAVAASVAVYATAAVVNTISAISSFFSNRARPQGPSANQPKFIADEVNGSASKMGGLGGNASTSSTIPAQQQGVTAQPPVHTAYVFRPANAANAAPAAPVQPVATSSVSGNSL